MEGFEEQTIAIEMSTLSSSSSHSADHEIMAEHEIEISEPAEERDLLPTSPEAIPMTAEEADHELEIVEEVDDLLPVTAEVAEVEIIEEAISDQTEALEPSIEELFADTRVPSWREQLTVRAFVVSFMLTVLFTFVAIKVNLTTGLIPTVTIPAALLGCCVIQYWVSLLTKFGYGSTPFTRQENAIIQTCFSTAYEIAFSGGVGTYLLAMTRPVSKQAGEGDKYTDTIELSPRWVVPFLFCVSYTGCFIAVTFRKTMIQRLKLPYPSGTAAGDLINSFHVPRSVTIRRTQSWALIGSSGFSFAWACFKWLFTGGPGCGFNNFPTFGLIAFKQRLYFDSSATYVGMGMISSYRVTYSLLVGAILSWTILWPLIHARRGEWFDQSLGDESIHGLQGYKVFISLSIIFGDALYNLMSVVYHMIMQQYFKCKPKPDNLPSRARPLAGISSSSYDDDLRAQYFDQDPIPSWVAILISISLAVISVLILPFVYVYLQWYQFLVPYLLAFPLAFCNAYGSGVTDWSLAGSYSRMIIYAMAAWAGVSEGGVLIGLGACGVITNIVSSAACISQDIKTGYMTLASPRAMLIAQIIGVTFGCILTPTVFFIFLSASPGIGGVGSDYPAPNALVFRLMAIVGVEGVSGLPKHCLLFSLIAFFGALVLDVVTRIGEVYQQKWVLFMPSPMAMAIPFYVGGSFVVDMCVGACILYVWGRCSRAYSDRYARIFASGLILGDGLWTMISSILPIVGIKPPMCLKVLSRDN